MTTMKVTTNPGRRGSEYIHVKGTRFRAPPNSKAKPGSTVTVTDITQGHVEVRIGAAGVGGRGAGKSAARVERWVRCSPLKAGGRTARRSAKRRTSKKNGASRKPTNHAAND